MSSEPVPLRAVVIPREYLTVQDAAQRAGVSRSWLELKCQTGELPALRIESAHGRGWRYLVRLDDVERLPLLPATKCGETVYAPATVFGWWIRKLRGRRSWSQAELSRRLGMGKSLVNSWERGCRLPSPSVLEQLIDLVWCSPEEERVLRSAYDAALAEREQRRQGDIAA